MSFLIKGVSSFLGLSDTPATFAAAALLNARVNAGETALEFGGSSQGLEVLTEENTLLFNGVAPIAWTDLQIFDAVGNKPRGVAFLEFNCAVAAARHWMVRPNGETADVDEWCYWQGYTHAGEPGPLGYALVPCDDAGLIEWRCGVAATNVQVTLRAFIANVNWTGTFPVGQQVFTGLAPAVWTGIDLGVGSALAIFRCVLNTALANQQCIFRRYGDTVNWPAVPSGGNVSGPSRVRCDQNGMGLAWVPTDTSGRVQWGDNLGNDWTVYLLGYIKNVTYRDLLVYNAIPLRKDLGYFQTLDLPVTKQVFAVLKNGANGAGSTMGLRQTGLTALFPSDGSQGTHQSGAWTGYQMQLTNDYGQLDICGHAPAGASPVSLELTLP